MCLITAEHRGAGAHVCAGHARHGMYSFVHLTLDNNWTGMIDIKWRKDKSSQLLTKLKS